MALPAERGVAIVPIGLAHLRHVREMLAEASGEVGGDPYSVTDGAAMRFIASGSAWRGLAFAAQAGDRFVGYAHLGRREPPHAAVGILQLYLLAPWRGQGLGERLMRALLAAAARRDRVEQVRVLLPAQAVFELRPWPSVPSIDAIWLAVERDNAPAMRLYEKLGFQRRPLDWDVPKELVTMVLATR